MNGSGVSAYRVRSRKVGKVVTPEIRNPGSRVVDVNVTGSRLTTCRDDGLRPVTNFPVLHLPRRYSHLLYSLWAQIALFQKHPLPLRERVGVRGAMFVALEKHTATPHPRLSLRSALPSPARGEGKPQFLTALGIFFSLIVFTGFLHAQGILPPKEKEPVRISSETAHHPLLIGDKVPESLTVVDSSGTTRSLMSFKGPVEILVVGFFSPRCAADQTSWHDWEMFYNAYKDWHVSFVGISSNQGETLFELTETLNRAHLPFPALRDENHRVADLLGVPRPPEMLIIDEWWILRYRGPLRVPGQKPHQSYARQALEAVIGHMDAVPNAEPGGIMGCPIQ